MSSIYSTRKINNGRVAIIRGLRDPSTVQVGTQTFKKEDLNPSILKFNEFWELMETIQVHGYLRGAMSVVGRSAVGAWWSLRRHPDYGKRASDLHRKRLMQFYTMNVKKWDNIKDYQNIVYKINIAAMYLRYFGQASFHILRDEFGQPVGMDFLHGMVVPNVDTFGYFKKDAPAFVQFPSKNMSHRVEFSNPQDIVYLMNPDFEGSPMGGTDVEALTTHVLPIDLYLQTSAREYLKNRDRPEVIYSLPPDISDDAFDAFVKEVQTRWSGPTNAGRSPIAVQGEFEVKELSKFPDKIPYQDNRKDARDEELAVTGVSGAKLGISDSLSSANVRELRREFHETSMIPLFKMIEVGFYEQIHLRTFGYNGWEFAFNSPDFLNAVERATVHMRYYQIGVMNPNEIRYDIGMEEREGGDEYVDESGNEVPEPQGSPPEGREQEPDDPAQTGEPTIDDQDPPRGDQHDEVIHELRTWRNFAIRRMRKGKRLRSFETHFVDPGLAGIVQDHINQADNVKDIVSIFDDVIDFYEEKFNGGEIRVAVH